MNVTVLNVQIGQDFIQWDDETLANVIFIQCHIGILVMDSKEASHTVYVSYDYE